MEDEQHFLITFSHQLAARYNRYPSSTVVSLLHSQCLYFGGSSHPAYILTITALPSEIQPATNKRNTAVLQKHMEAILHVPPSRGMVRFVPVIEECLAWGSKTVAGRISDAVAKDREITSEGEGSKSHERRILKAMTTPYLYKLINTMLIRNSHYHYEGLQRILHPRARSLQLPQNMETKPPKIRLLA